MECKGIFIYFIGFILFSIWVFSLILNLYIDLTIPKKYGDLFRREEGFSENKFINRLFLIVVILLIFYIAILPSGLFLYKCFLG
jgi:hypothetical protein